MRIHGQQYRTIWLSPNTPEQVCVLDQRLLPHSIEVVRLQTVADTAVAIADMIVRGAGLIGVTAAYGLYLASISAPRNGWMQHLVNAGNLLLATRPTARNLRWAVEKMLSGTSSATSVAEARDKALNQAQSIADQDIEACRAIGSHGLQILKELAVRKGDKLNILTHCNAGWLAFVDIGTATAPIYAARDEGLDVHVWVSETRPWFQGARLTSFELTEEGVENTLITDNNAGHLMQQGLVDVVIVGSDRTLHTGEVVNKIGTYLKAVAAKDNGIPFYVALPCSTIDWSLDKGAGIPIEQRKGEEITAISGKSSSGEITTVQIAAEKTNVINHVFDITPPRLVSGLITERGVIQPIREEIHKYLSRTPAS